jgi:hypothetical protein
MFMGAWSWFRSKYCKLNRDYIVNIFFLYLFIVYYIKPLEPSDVCSLCGAYQASTSESMQVKIIGCLGPIALRQGDINTNKVMYYSTRRTSRKRFIYELNYIGYRKLCYPSIERYQYQKDTS